MNGLIEAGAVLLGSLAPLLAKALNAKNESHEAILIEARAAAEEFLAAVAGFEEKLRQRDAEMDAALAAKFHND